MIEQLKKRLGNPDSLVSLFLGLAVVIVIGVLIVNYVKERRVSGPATETEKKAGQTTSGSEAGSSHTVVAGETLWSIAEKTIGSGYNWVDIRDANKLTSADRIEVGQTLTIPAVAKREPGQIANAMVEVKRPEGGKYTVNKGDSLWKISVATYGTGFRWTEIAKANNLSHPNVIHAGNVLVLP